MGTTANVTVTQMIIDILYKDFCISFQAHSVKVQGSRILNGLRYYVLYVGGGWSAVFHRVQSQHSISQEMCEHFMLISPDKLHGHAASLFQHDIAPAHSSKTTIKRFARHYCVWLAWPGTPAVQQWDRLPATSHVLKFLANKSQPSNEFINTLSVNFCIVNTFIMYLTKHNLRYWNDDLMSFKPISPE